MTEVPEHLAYTAEHEWIAQDEPTTVGITAHAVSELGDIVFVELPETGVIFEAGDVTGHDDQGRIIVSLAVEPWMFDKLAAFDAGGEDLEESFHP